MYVDTSRNVPTGLCCISSTDTKSGHRGKMIPISKLLIYLDNSEYGI